MALGVMARMSKVLPTPHGSPLSALTSLPHHHPRRHSLLPLLLYDPLLPCATFQPQLTLISTPSTLPS